MRKNNRIVVDLSKVAYAELHWVTHCLGTTYRRHSEPVYDTVNGHEFDYNETRILGNAETMYQYAVRRNLIDEWHPELILQLSNSHSLVYTKDKALSLWKAWRAKQFGKKGK